VNEALNIAAHFLDPISGIHEDWSPTPASKSLYHKSSYTWLGGEPGYPRSLLDRVSTPDTVLLAVVLDEIPYWEDVLDAALSRAQRRMAIITKAFERQPSNFTYRQLSDHLLGLWRSEFIGHGGGHVLLVDKVALPQPRHFRRFPFFRRVHTTELVMPQPE